MTTRIEMGVRARLRKSGSDPDYFCRLFLLPGDVDRFVDVLEHPAARRHLVAALHDDRRRAVDLGCDRELGRLAHLALDAARLERLVESFRVAPVLRPA